MTFNKKEIQDAIHLLELQENFVVATMLKDLLKQNINLIGIINNHEYYQNGYRQAQLEEQSKYENKWHDLRKNPSDLPRASGKYLAYTGDYFIMDFDTETNDFGYWVGSVGSGLGMVDTEFQTLKERDEDEVIAWCELPQFIEDE